MMLRIMREKALLVARHGLHQPRERVVCQSTVVKLHFFKLRELIAGVADLLHVDARRNPRLTWTETNIEDLCPKH